MLNDEPVAVIVRAYGSKPVAMRVMGTSKTHVDVARLDPEVTLRLARHGLVFEYSDDLQSKLEHAFGNDDRETLEALWLAADTYWGGEDDDDG